MWALLSINIDFNFYKRWSERRSSLLIQLCNAEFLSLSLSLFSLVASTKQTALINMRELKPPYAYMRHLNAVPKELSLNFSSKSWQYRRSGSFIFSAVFPHQQDRTSRSKFHHPSFVFCRSWILIPALRPAFLTEIAPVSLGRCWYSSFNMSLSFPSWSFKFTLHTILLFDIT